MQALKAIAVWFTFRFCAAILLCHTDIIYTLVKAKRLQAYFSSSPLRFPGLVWRERTHWRPWLASMVVRRGMLC